MIEADRFEEMGMIVALEALAPDRGYLKMVELGLIRTGETIALNTDNPEEGIDWAKSKGFTDIRVVNETYTRSGRLIPGNVAIVGVYKGETPWPY